MSSKASDDEFAVGADVDAAARAREAQSAKDRQVTYFAVALATSAVPVYMFQTLRNMPMSVGYNAPIYAVGVIFCSVILSIAYRNVATAGALKLAKSKEMDVTQAMVRPEALQTGQKVATLVLKKKAAIQAEQLKESMMYSLFYNNTLFIATSLFLGFVVFGKMSAPFSYLLTSCLAAILTSLVASKQLDK